MRREGVLFAGTAPATDFGMFLFETGPKVVANIQALNNVAGIAQLGLGIAVVQGGPTPVLSSQINSNQAAGVVLAGCSPADVAEASFVETQVINNPVGFVLQSLCGFAGCPGGSFTELGGDNVFSNPQPVVSPLPVPDALPRRQE